MTSPITAARPVLLDKALEAFKARDRDQAAALLARLVETNPPLGPTWGPVSRLAAAMGEVSTALAAAERHAALDRGNPLPRLNFGQMLAQNGRGQQARAVAEALVVDQPDNPAAWHFLGSCRAELGETASAIDDFRRAISLAGGHYAAAAASWLAVAESKTFRQGDPDIGQMEKLLARSAPTDSEREARAPLQFALGKAYDDIGLTDRAFASYSDGARVIDATRNGGTGDATAFVDEVIAEFDRETFAELPPSDVSANRPIFVLGLPRSGTTLVEQMLVSHRLVADGAELNLFKAACMPIGGFSPAAIKAYAARRPDGLSHIGRVYLDMLDDRFGGDGRIVDKTLNHSRYLGLIHHVLPNARFIWLRREPGAVAWSCFRTWFARGVDWSWSLEAIGRHFRAEDRLYDHWSRIMGDAILTVPYEALVSDPGPWIERILDHVGLPFQEGLETFHKTDRAVNTASFAQVRRPLYTSSTHAWRRYEPHLQPFFDAFLGV